MSSLTGAVALELRVQSRYGIFSVAAGLTALWTAALLVMPVSAASAVGPLVLFIDTVAFGVTLLAGLLMFERAEGARAALAVSPLRSGAYLAARTLTLTGISTLSAVPIALAAMRGQGRTLPELLAGLAPVLLGVVPATVLFLALAAAAAGNAPDLMRFLVLAPLPMLPFLVVPLGHLAGFLEHPAVYAVPTTGALELIRLGLSPEAAPQAGWSALAAVYLVLWCAGLIVLALRQLSGESAGAGPRERAEALAPAPVAAVADTPVSREPSPRRPRGGVLTALALIDLRGVGRDLMLVMFVAAPILLALALRFGYPPAADFVRTSYGVDTAPYDPLLLAVVVLLHVPLMAGPVGALRVIEDADDHTLAVLRVSPASLGGYLTYRLVLTTLAALAGLGVAVPLSGLAPGGWSWALVVAVVLAAAQAPLIMLAVTAVAGNKVEALAVLKVMGIVMLLPVAMWFLPGTTGWFLAWLPPFWPVQALWGEPAAPVGLSAAAGVAITVAAAVLLLRRTVRRIETL